MGFTWEDLCPESVVLFNDDDLMKDYLARRLRPLPAGILPLLPLNIPHSQHIVAEHMELRRGLRLAAGEDPTWSFAYPICKNAAELGLSAPTVQWAIKGRKAVGTRPETKGLIQLGVIQLAGERSLSGREKPMHLYLPGSKSNVINFPSRG